jgi:chromatin remodeling complex protein RSC6
MARKPNAAFMKPVQPDAILAAIVGSKPLPRTELTKKLWAHIKKKGLQDKKNRRMIHADELLKPLFSGKSSANMFELTKYASKHVK